MRAGAAQGAYAAALLLLACAGPQGAGPRAGPGEPEADDERSVLRAAAEAEKAFGASGHLLDAPALDAYLGVVVERLQPPRGAAVPFRVRVILARVPNALSMPNGALYVTSGYLARLDEEAKLAAILGHEMAPQEAAEAVIDGLQSAGWSALQIVEDAPATLAGNKGFRLVASYRTEDGLRAMIALYGVVLPEGVWFLMFHAPERVYFARHLPEFDALAASFQLRPDARGIRRRHAEEAPAGTPGDAPAPAAPKPTPAPST